VASALDRIAGPVILIIGLLLLATVLVWLGLYLNERTFTRFFSEWSYWLPVCIFLLPAIHLIYNGREMMMGRGGTLLIYIEIFINLSVLTIIALLGFS